MWEIYKFDFSEVESFDFKEVIRKSLKKARSAPMIHLESSASDKEIIEMEKKVGIIFPEQYKYFLNQCKAVIFDFDIYLGRLGTFFDEPVKVLWNKKRVVFATKEETISDMYYCWDVEDLEGEVFKLKHSWGGGYGKREEKPFAPNFCLAFWRLCKETIENYEPW